VHCEGNVAGPNPDCALASERPIIRSASTTSESEAIFVFIVSSP
jgi:hypothetical protein